MARPSVSLQQLQANLRHRASLERQLVRRLEQACFLGSDRQLCDTVWQEAVDMDFDLGTVTDHLFQVDR